MASPPARSGRRILLIALLAALVILAALAVVIAGQAGQLPGQPEATRIPITPFANLPMTPPAATTTP